METGQATAGSSATPAAGRAGRARATKGRTAAAGAPEGEVALAPVVGAAPSAGARARRAPAAGEARDVWLRDVWGDPTGAFEARLRGFADFGAPTAVGEVVVATPGGGRRAVPTYTNELWTARQRQAHSLHEVSYRACFKPQLPAFFVDALTRPGDAVLDPFMGRGTTPLEAALRGRRPLGNDLNPLSRHLLAPRLDPPEADEVEARLGALDLDGRGRAAFELDRLEPGLLDDLRAFFHDDTLRALCALREHLARREAEGALDRVDAWLRMVATNRLTGHSPGFLSVYTLPPNQATTARAQREINRKRGQAPEPRQVAPRLARKSRALLADLDAAGRAALREAAAGAWLSTGPADALDLPDGSVDLVVTSPPFLDVVDYATDNWLRGWFCGVDTAGVALTVPRGLDAWQAAMTAVLRELRRVVRAGGHVAFEVGEVRGGALRLEEAVLPCAVEAGLEPVLVAINAQDFTKTANCWGVDNGRKGTNTNRVVLLRRG